MVVVFGDGDGDCFGWWSFDSYGEVGGEIGGRLWGGSVLVVVAVIVVEMKEE